MTSPNDLPPRDPYRAPGEREQPVVHLGPPTWVKGVVIAIAVALGVPAIMLAALFVLIIGVCSHGR